MSGIVRLQGYGSSGGTGDKFSRLVFHTEWMGLGIRCGFVPSLLPRVINQSKKKKKKAPPVHILLHLSYPESLQVVRYNWPKVQSDSDQKNGDRDNVLQLWYVSLYVSVEVRLGNRPVQTR
jgi:hypothetical protein